MAYAKLIDSQLKMAFRQAKDLAVDAVFKPKVASGFDFASGTPIVTLATPIATQVIPFDGKKQREGAKRIIKNILVKAKDVGELNMYDTVAFEGFDWTISNTIKGSGYIYVIEVSRGIVNVK